MIAVILVLLNLTTAVLLDNIEEGLLNLRLSQHDLQLTRAWRAKDSATAYALAQFQQGQSISSSLSFAAGLEAIAAQSVVDCTSIPQLPSEAPTSSSRPSSTPSSTPSSALSSGPVATASRNHELADDREGYQCWLLLIRVQQPSQNLRVEEGYWLLQGPNNERTWLPQEQVP